MLKKDDRTKQMVYYQVSSMSLCIYYELGSDENLGRYWDLYLTASCDAIDSEDFQGTPHTLI